MAADGDTLRGGLVDRDEALIDAGDEERRDGPAVAGGEERCETLEDA